MGPHPWTHERLLSMPMGAVAPITQTWYMEVRSSFRESRTNLRLERTYTEMYIGSMSLSMLGQLHPAAVYVFCLLGDVGGAICLLPTPCTEHLSCATILLDTDLHHASTIPLRLWNTTVPPCHGGQVLVLQMTVPKVEQETPL